MLNSPDMQVTKSLAFARFCVFVSLVANAAAVSAQALAEAAAVEDPVVAACRSSARLNDLQLLSEDHLIAVGDRGLILHTDSGGRTWQARESTTTASLRAVAAAERVLLAVGGDIGSYTRKSIGVVLRSLDQGRSWRQATNEILPRLQGISYQSGRWIAWGDYSPVLGTSVFESLDNGTSWQPVDCPLGHIATGTTLTAGQSQGRTFGAVDRLGNAVFSRESSGSVSLSTPQRPIHAIAMTGNSWIVAGNEGLLLFSHDTRSWQPISTPLSAQALRLCDWSCIEQVGNQIWIAGTPGSVMLHSADAGQSWQVQHTGSRTPVKRVQFFDSARGWAINALGGILATRDGGQTWYPQRALAQRLGILSFAEQENTVPWQPLIASVWDDNVAAGSISVTPIDAVLNADFHPGSDQQLSSAAERMGLAFHSTLHRSAQTRSSLVSRIAMEVLVWQPDVVLVANSTSGKSRLPMENSVRQGIEAIKRPEIVGIARELGLSTWAPKKLVATANDRRQQFSESSHRVLSTVGLSVEDVLFALPQKYRQDDISMRTVWSESSTPAASRSLLGGVPPSPQTHRGSRLDDVGNYQLVMGRVHRRKTLESLTTQALSHPDDPSVGSTWPRSLRTAITSMPEREIAPSLAELAHRLKAPATWRYYEETLKLLIESRPNSDAADWAQTELLAASASDELRAWSQSEANKRESSNQQPVQLASATASIPGGDLPATASGEDDSARKVWNGSPFGNLPNGSPAKPITGAQVVSAAALRGVPVTADSKPETIWRPPYQRSLADWFSQSQAVNSGAGIQLWPTGQLMSGSVVRRSQPAGIRATDTALQPLASKPQLLGWPQVARQEWLYQSGRAEELKWIARAATGAARPTLDGDLSDPCWLTAVPIELEEPFSTATHRATKLYWAKDEEYLYIAISCEQGNAPVPPLATTRTYDADLTDVDRIELLIDTDRDYNTSFYLGIGQDGRTFDSCAGSSAYNPRWFVAVTQNSGTWSAEIAIDLRDLTAQPIAVGDAWAISARRRGPDVVTQSWSQLRTDELIPQAAGLLLFTDPATVKSN
ncbi:MAG: hypothetical protein Aurels2KO_08810 [Aureliella sp.]